MKKSLLCFALATTVALASIGCGSASEEQDLPSEAAGGEDALTEGEEVMSVAEVDVQAGNPQLTGIISWDMLVIRKEGRQYYVFAGYDGYGKTREHARLEVVFEQVPEGVRFTTRSPDGQPVTLSKEVRESVIADVGDMIKDAPESVIPFDPATGKCRKGKLSIPVKLLLYTAEAVLVIGCGGTVLVPMVGLPACAAFAGTMIFHQVIEKKVESKCK